MQFVFPAFLWALSLLAVPVLIHLFYFRRYKKVPFTNVQFLKELVEETSSRNNLRNLLILLARLAALAALVFAFAQPFFAGSGNMQKQSRAVSIFVDNSYSMSGNSEEGSLVQKAKRRAKDIIQAYSEDDRFQILTHELDGRHQRLVSKTDALDLLEEISVTPAVHSLSKVVNKQKQCLQQALQEAGDLYLISDFQQSITDLEIKPEDSAYHLYLIPIQSVQENNLSIDTAYFASPVFLPGQTNTLIYQVRNHGNENAEEVRTSLELNGQEYPGKQLHINAGKSAWDSLSIQIQNPGWQKLHLKIQDFPIQFDNHYYMSCKTDDEIQVLLIYGSEIPATMYKAIESIPFFKLQAQQQNRVDYGSFGSKRLIILSDLSEITSGLASELKKALAEGCNVLVFPAAQMNPSSYQPLSSMLNLPKLENFELSKKEVTKANLESDVFQDVFMNPKAHIKLPSTAGQYSFSGGSPAEKILSYRDGSSMMNRHTVERGSVFLSASPVDPKYNEWGKSAEIFIPLLFKAAFSSQQMRTLAYDLTANPVISWPWETDRQSQELMIQLKGPEELIPAIRTLPGQLRIEVYDQIQKAGIYEIRNEQDVLGLVAFNDSRKESDPSVRQPDDLESKYGAFARVIPDSANSDFTSTIQAEKAGTPFWWWLLLATFVFLILETLFIRFWKTA